jgi:hypothetical protein
MPYISSTNEGEVHQVGIFKQKLCHNKSDKTKKRFSEEKTTKGLLKLEVWKLLASVTQSRDHLLSSFRRHEM